MEMDLWWFGHQCLGILLVLWLLWIVELLPVTMWTFQVTRCILWSRCFIMMKQFFKIINPYTQPEVFSLGLIWCTSTSSPASTIDRLKYHQNTVVSFREYGEKQIPSSIIPQATTKCSPWRVVKYSTTDYSELIWFYSKKDTSCILAK